LDGKQQPIIMADAHDVVERSFNINSKLGPRLIAAAEQNAILRIGWTNAGEPVPKNGELGLCPNLPEGARMRALGVLGSWIAPFGSGGTFTLQGDAGAFLGAGNRGNTIVCERLAGDYAGFAMRDGKVSILDGAGNDTGAQMEGGLLIVRGATGARVGGGMSDGLIVVHGDVGSDPGAGMTGGRIIINGRCPTPPVGVSLRPLTAAEVKAVNKQLKDEELHVPSDAVCLTPAETLKVEAINGQMSSSDLSMIGLVSDDRHHTSPYATYDTVTLVGDRGDTGSPSALPLPLLAIIQDGNDLSLPKDSMPHAVNLLANQPFLVRENPRSVDFALIDQHNLADAPELLLNSAGAVFDFDHLPSMNSEQMDGFFVAVRTLMGREKPFGMLNGLGRTTNLHVLAAHHGADLAISRIEDGSGVPEPAALPIIGRSTKANLEGAYTDTGVLLGLSASAHDLAVLKASGIGVVACEIPMADAQDLAHWLQSLHQDLAGVLSRLGLESIDRLQRQHLRALDHETAAVSGLRLVGYERPLPHWFAR
jgi:formylmethanofuran dehydrogenase subunit C